VKGVEKVGRRESKSCGGKGVCKDVGQTHTNKRLCSTRSTANGITWFALDTVLHMNFKIQNNLYKKSMSEYLQHMYNSSSQLLFLPSLVTSPKALFSID